MEKRHCETLEALREAIERYGPGVLYRGQAQNYTGSEGLPTLSTSFQRQGCVPDLMIKWTYYAKRALQHLVRGWKDTGDTATDQAILQHYGFRSFFLDASGDPRVAAWFASNRFESKIAVNLVEDCFEDPVWLRTLNAWFVPTEEVGHLYLISQKSLRQSGIQAVHLSEIATDQGAPRYARQDAYMVGPLIQSGLSSDCILCHITAPAEVLRNFAGDYNVGWLFPEPSDDPVYQELLAMPWEKMRHVPDDILEAFRRSLELPEYSCHLQKHMPPRSAMYRPFWTRDLPPLPACQTATSTQIAQVLCGSSLYHGASTPRFILPEINKLLEEYDEISIELDGLVYHGMDTKYGKGVGIVKMPEKIVCIFEYGVDHPGLRIMGVGRFYGLHYRIDSNGGWERITHEDDCTCGSDHTENFTLLGRIDISLKNQWLKCVEPGLYVQEGVDLISDRRATWGEPY
ncbi:FRG domain-containing protein [Pseudomonas chlororaphis]|uniref:FRG domain-containing protein n=1 Tax=Pseudomonas chlororaphis TaxID=587753 RepID=UPI002368839E|nr:FRG domain-containing protein [Pseudomonas chlororaphis]WDG50454.1 FRG domain-containing protein [Pseudomonas chlororaphis]